MGGTFGLDVGSRSIELVRLERGEPVERRRLFPDGPPKRLAATGYGRELVRELYPGCDVRTVTEIKAHALGAARAFRHVRALLDIGGQDTKAMALLSGGKVGRFEMNDRCAAGTGKFLEYTAGVFGLPIEQFGQFALTGANPPEISSMCTVFAETEATTLMARGVPPQDIALGLHRAMIKRAAAMLRRIDAPFPLAFVGGVAKNPCAVALLRKELNAGPDDLLVPEEPDMTGALGAALWLEGEEEGRCGGGSGPCGPQR